MFNSNHVSKIRILQRAFFITKVIRIINKILPTKINLSIN